MILSILIPTKKSRKKHFDGLLSTLLPQIEGLDGQIEILAETDNETPITKKHEELLKDAQGKYAWFLKDSFLLSETAIKDIFRLTDTDIEVMEIRGVSVINGKAHDWQEVSRHSPMLLSFAKELKLFKDDQEQKQEILSLRPITYLIENPIIHRRIELTVIK